MSPSRTEIAIMAAILTFTLIGGFVELAFRTGGF